MVDILDAPLDAQGIAASVLYTIDSMIIEPNDPFPLILF